MTLWPPDTEYELYVREGISLMNALALAAQKWPDAHPSEIHLIPHNSGDPTLYLTIRWSHTILTHNQGS